MRFWLLGLSLVAGPALAQDISLDELFGDTAAEPAAPPSEPTPPATAPAKKKDPKKPAAPVAAPALVAAAPVAEAPVESAPPGPEADQKLDAVEATATPSPVGAAVTAEALPPHTGRHRFGGDAGFGLAVRGDVGMFNGRTFGVKASSPSLSEAQSGDGIQGFGGGVLLQAAWHLPLDGSALDRVFGAEFDVGYTLTGTTGEIAFSQYESSNGETKLVTTTYAYQGLLHTVPVSLGLRARLPLDLPLHIDLSAGGLGVWGLSTTTSTVVDGSAPFAADNTASDLAFGYYGEGGVAFDVGPGELTAAYRYQSAFLDFGHTAFNPTLGDLGGHHILVGYRFLL